MPIDSDHEEEVGFGNKNRGGRGGPNKRGQYG